MSRAALVVARVLLTLPDCHRVHPWWRALRVARVGALRRSGVTVGDGVMVHERTHFDRRVKVVLGHHSEVRDRVRIGIAEVGGRSGSFSLGEGSVVLSDTQVDCTASVTIGRGTHVGRRAQVFTHAHDVSSLAVPVLEAPVTSAPVTIGNDVMIYNDVVILPGVTVGDGAVVAIRAVVSRDVPAGAIVAGVPARVISRRAD
jgi:acetyltransferase-like isoleucine patch superfamily enzyme